MKNKEKMRERFLRDPLPLRLGALAATLGRVASVARWSSNPVHVVRLLEEGKYMIEWTAAEAEPEVAFELVWIQRLLSCWLKSWSITYHRKEQQTLLSLQAKYWSDQVLRFSGLVS